MGFQTVLKYGTSESMQGASDITGEGRPSSMTLQGLQDATTYYAQAELYLDGGLQSVSNKESFQTVRAGNGSVVYRSYTREGDGTHVVTYDYTSTYAATSAYLIQHGSPDVRYQGTIDSAGWKLVFRIPSGTWRGGSTYTISAGFLDIYAEEFASADTTVQVPYANSIVISEYGKTTTSVTVYLEKVLEGGFSSGEVSYWDYGSDPDKDTPSGSVKYSANDSTVTVTGLVSYNCYIFRASAVLADGVTEVVSNTLNACTPGEHDFDEFEIYADNPDSGSQAETITVRPLNFDLQSSTDGGVTWSTVSTGSISIPRGTGVRFRGNNPGGVHGPVGSTYIFSIDAYSKVSIRGNIMSLVSRTSFPYLTEISGNNFFHALFGGTKANVMDVSGLTFGQVSVVNGSGALDGMFQDMTSITAPPVMSSIRRIDGNTAAWCLFYGCSSLASAPDFSNIEYVGTACLSAAFEGCSSLRESADLSSVAYAGDRAFESMYAGCTSMTRAISFSSLSECGFQVFNTTFQNCTSLTSAPSFASIRTSGSYCFSQTFRGCTALVTPPAMPSISSAASGSFSYMFYQCTHLTTAPSFPNLRSIDSSAFGNMFNGCQRLASGVDLRAITSVNGGDAFDNMYNWCSALAEAYAPGDPAIWPNGGSTDNWLGNVAASGTLYAPDSTVAAAIPLNSASGCPSGWTVRVSPV